MLTRFLRPLLPAVGALIAVLVLLAFEHTTDLTMLMAPFGASCVIVFALPDSPLARPRNVIGGHMISALTGLIVYHAFGNHIWSIALAVALSVYLMQVTGTIHPPAGADPIVVILAGAGWSFLFAPVLAGAVILVGLSALYRYMMKKRAQQQQQSAASAAIAKPTIVKSTSTSA
ncbi:HPP family protein [Paenibacillus sp. PR3]|uniref:HPP family protein n=1 Tax=Paenibacillus terricola TaxID=2763503 RepID=A0ABR8N1A6_9BACL|nr:HPP family protein [Paenibacillus terricola]MBD3921933.1 HPP family protein [Paenibacillus terricola]